MTPTRSTRRPVGRGGRRIFPCGRPRRGEAGNRKPEAIRRIAAAVPFPIQVGGGLRDADCVANALRAGAEQVVIGTAAMRDPEFLGRCWRRTASGSSSRSMLASGKVSLAGWTETADVEACRRGRRPDRTGGRTLPLHRRSRSTARWPARPSSSSPRSRRRPRPGHLFGRGGDARRPRCGCAPRRRRTSTA